MRKDGFGEGDADVTDSLPLCLINSESEREANGELPTSQFEGHTGLGRRNEGNTWNEGYFIVMSAS